MAALARVSPSRLAPWVPKSQYHLPFRDSGSAGPVVALVPAHRFPLLDRHISSLAAIEPKLAGLVHTLAAKGHCQWGDLIRMDEAAVLALTEWHNPTVDLLLDLLHRFELCLGMGMGKRWKPAGGLFGPHW